MDKYSNNFNNYKNNNHEKYNNTDKNNSQGDYYHDNDRVVNGESLNIDTTLDKISKDIHPGETLVLDIGNNYYNQADEIFDTLVLQGFDVKKSFRNGRNQIIVHKKSSFE